MVATKKPMVVIIGAGLAGLTAAHKLHTSTPSFDIRILEAGSRIGGRIRTATFFGDRVETGATWIHGIEGSPIHDLARSIGALDPDGRPFECMDLVPDEPITVIPGNGTIIEPRIVNPVTSLYKDMIAFGADGGEGSVLGDTALKRCMEDRLSVGRFLRSALEVYQEENPSEEKLIEEAVFEIHENMERAHTAADDLGDLNFQTEREYKEFPGEQITIPRGYSSVIEWLASALPLGAIQLNRQVVKIEWQSSGSSDLSSSSPPVRIQTKDGALFHADHVIVTVSLGVLKAGIDSGGFFSPAVPQFKVGAIRSLGFGVVDKLFLQLGETYTDGFPSLQFAFDRRRKTELPLWLQQMATLSPVYRGSRVLLGWFAGKEALTLESLSEGEVLSGVETLMASVPTLPQQPEFTSAMWTKWGTDPLFMGSYSYVSVGSSGEDFDRMAEPLPSMGETDEVGASPPPLQVMFAGEATHRSHYSTTHGAYFSGIREAERLMKHYRI
ncbi:putative polyamine oxidase 5 [Acorus gramineus]|uniref:Polyamine oxidase 5 n=1 Tax=Acorus gramineus TaxID=55184 RepID=A0AAV9A4A7_ACOGR|nr:putative polyamine oxidase 5 [Acorus gramineus]